MSLDTSTLKQWIRENPEKAASAKIVAAQNDISIHTLHKEFHRKEGITIAHFIDGVRLVEVKKILLTTDKLVFEIAQQFTSGREDVLTRWFKARTGMTMGEFRQKNGNVARRGGQNLNENELVLRLHTKIAYQHCKENFVASTWALN